MYLDKSVCMLVEYGIYIHGLSSDLEQCLVMCKLLPLYLNSFKETIRSLSLVRVTPLLSMTWVRGSSCNGNAQGQIVMLNLWRSISLIIAY